MFDGLHKWHYQILHIKLYPSNIAGPIQSDPQLYIQGSKSCHCHMVLSKNLSKNDFCILQQRLMVQ